MWLSAANKTINSAKGTATSAAKRGAALAQEDATRQILEFWSAKPSKAAPQKSRVVSLQNDGFTGYIKTPVQINGQQRRRGQAISRQEKNTHHLWL